VAFSIYTFSNSVNNLVNKNNTTTSGLDISSGLKKRIQKITMGFHENKPNLNILYPAVWVEPKVKSSNFAKMGGNAYRSMTVDYQIIGIVQTGLGVFDGREESDGEMLKLSANLDTLLRNFIKLSQTSVTMSLVESTEYDVIESNDTYNSICKLNLKVNIWSD